MNYRSVAQLNRDLSRLIGRLPRNLDVVVGIPRSGVLVANLLALHLNLPMTDVDGLISGRLMDTGFTKAYIPDQAEGLSKPRNVLVVDDSICTGRQMCEVRKRIEGARLAHNVLYGAVYVQQGTENLVDVYCQHLPQPRVFQWNVMHSDHLPSSCVDIDGILCLDPTDEENDDGARYRQFLRATPCLVRPTQKIGWLVTCRLEKYRSDTEVWLQAHGIAYDHLVMMDLPDRDTRLALANHAAFKADVYKRTGAVLFLESSASQAMEIARLSGKYVLCFDTGEMMAPNQRAETLRRLTNTARVWHAGLPGPLRRALRFVYRRVLSGR